MGPVLGLHARTDRTRDTRVAEPRPPAPEDGRPGEGRPLRPDAPHNGGRPPPPGTPPHQPRGTQPPQGMQAKGTVLGPPTHTTGPTGLGWQPGEGQRLTSDAPHNGGRHPPPGTPFRHPHSQQRRPARAHAVGPPLGPHARTDRTRDTRVAEPRPPAPEGRRLGEGQRLTPDAPHNGGRPPPPGTAPHHPSRHAAPTGHAGQGDSVGSQHPHARDHSMWVADPNSPPNGQAVWEGGWPDHRRPSQRWKAPPRERPSATPTGSNVVSQGRRLWGRGSVPRPHRPHLGHTGRGTPAARPRGRGAGEGTAPDTRRPSQQWQATPHGDGPPAPPSHASPQGMQAKGTVLGPHTHTSAPTARGWRTPNSPPSGRVVQGGGAPDHRRPSQWWKAPLRERPSATPAVSNAGPQWRTLWSRCWVPTPAPTAPKTHGSRNPGYPPQRTNGRGRDSA